MGRAEVLQGVQEMRFEGLLDRHKRGELSRIEATEMLEVRNGPFAAGATGCAMRAGGAARPSD